MGKNVLIIGGDSFIAKKFISANKDYFNLYSVSRQKTEFQNEFVINDLFNVPESKFENIDVVINFAAIVHKPKIKDKSIYELINYKLPLFLAKLALKNNCSHFIQMSTIAVYGNTEQINDETICSPYNYYGEYKLKADIELNKLSKDNFLVTSIRCSMVYGGINAPGNMSSLIKLVKTNLPLPFKGINNKRQFLNVNNLTQALKGIIEQKLQGIIILADEEYISTYELVDIIAYTLKIENKCIRLNVFWKLIKMIKPEFAGKLIGNLLIENTYSFKKIGIALPYSIGDGIKEMLSREEIK